MSPALITACFWVLAATATAMLPMRLQRIVGLGLLLSAPVLLAWIGMTHGWLVTLACCAAVISMFRHPLRYFWRKLRGAQTDSAS